MDQSLFAKSRRGLATFPLRTTLLVSLALFTAAPTRALQVFNYNPALNLRFSSGTYAASNLVANPTFILAGYDLSGIGWGAGGLGLTLISPQHFVTAAHVTPLAGGVVSFLNRDGVVKTYVVESVYSVEHTPGVRTDLVVGRLTQPIPAADHVGFFPTLRLSTTYAYMGLKVYSFGFYQSCGTNNIENYGTYDMLPFAGPDGLLDDTLFATNYDQVNGEAQAQGNDSGSPTFTIANGRLAIVGTHSAVGTSSLPYTTNDVLLNAYFDKINARLALDGYVFGDAATTVAAVVPVVAATPPKVAAAPGADFNGDGQADILLENPVTGERGIGLMSGTVLASRVSLGAVTTDWRIAGRGDFDGDGQCDILWQNTRTGACGFWLMNKTAFVRWVLLATVTTDWQIAGTGDFNGDGQTDLVWQNTLSGIRGLWLMNRLAYSSWVNLGTATTDWRIAGTGDFNLDGRTDILWENTRLGVSGAWLMNGTAFSSWVQLGSLAPGWRLVGTGDFNGDGRVDLLLENSAAGQDSITLLNGTATSGTAGLPLPAGWHAAK
jgi:hypothetical protein